MGIFKTFKTRMGKLNPYANIATLSKQLQLNQVAMDGLLRPGSGGNRGYEGSTFVVPRYPLPLETLYDVAYNSDTLSTIHFALKLECFRNGFELLEADSTDSDTMTSEDDVKTNNEYMNGVLERLDNVNENGQSNLDVHEELEDDWNIMDDIFKFYLFDYKFNSAGEISDYDLREMMRMDPKYMGLVMNYQDRPGYDDKSNILTVCPDHRNALLTNTELCPQCNKMTYKAYYRHLYRGDALYYFKHEVYHKSRYRKSKRLGFSPIITVWQKNATLWKQDKYILEMYTKERPPKSALFFKTSNVESLKAAWEEAKVNANANPHHPVVMAIQSSGIKGEQGKFVEFVDFMRSLDDLQFTEQREEYRRTIGAVYGVLPIWQADTSTSGGLNNEGMQITVTNRRIQANQSGHDDIFKNDLKAMKVEGLVLKLKPSEEQDEMAKLDRQQKSLEIGEKAAELGLEVVYVEDTDEVKIHPGTIEARSPISGFPGIPQNSNSFDSPPTNEGDVDNSGTPEEPSFNKADKQKKKPNLGNRANFTTFSKTLEENVDIFLKKFKRKPSSFEMSKMIKEIDKNLYDSLKSSVGLSFDKVYKDQMDFVGKDLGVNIVFGQVDVNALEALKNQDVLSKAFKDLSNDVVSKLNLILNESYANPAELTVAKITEKIKDVADVTDYRAENIARTELGKVASAARRNSYKKEDSENEFNYLWIGPNDHRTTSTSKRIKKRVGKGVKWQKLINIIEEESIKDFPKWVVDKNFPVSHYQSRHIFLRTQGSLKDNIFFKT